jgi:hypothetical protein
MTQIERKENCWEHMRCGRGPAEAHRNGLEPCPAATEDRLHGAHGGLYAGRACWIIDGTMCNDEVAGSFASKLEECLSCPFYEQVKHEEHPEFKLSFALLSMLKSGV